MEKKVYGQIVINMLADEKIIQDTEGVLYSLSDVLMDKILDVAEVWNKQNKLIEIEIKEPIGVIEDSELS